MRATILAVVALLGSLLLAPMALQSVRAATGAPDLKSALGTTHDGLMLVRGGGGHMGGGMGGGHMGGMIPMGGTAHMAGVGHMGPRFGGRSFGPVGLHRDFRHHAFFFPHDRFHHRFFATNVFVFGGYPYYYGDCYWLKRRALTTGSPYWWARYEACLGYY